MLCCGRLLTYFTSTLPLLHAAAYLANAEYARWEMVAYNGMLSAMYKHNVNYYVVGTTIRYRKEIRPIFRTFQVDTEICGIHGRTMWISHKFRLPAKANHPESRILAQMIVQGVAVQGRNVVDFADFLKQKVGLDPNAVDSLALTDDEQQGGMPELIERYMALEDSLKQEASRDDERLGREE